MPRNEPQEVIFITADSEMAIRMMDHRTTAICEAAVLLKATHFVTLDGFGLLTGQPVWGVFEMRTAEKDTPVPREWSIRDPIRKFALDCRAGAVMFALHQRRR